MPTRKEYAPESKDQAVRFVLEPRRSHVHEHARVGPNPIPFSVVESRQTPVQCFFNASG